MFEFFKLYFIGLVGFAIGRIIQRIESGSDTERNDFIETVFWPYHLWRFLRYSWTGRLPKFF